ncbi:MAG: bacteriohemerythrin [Lachnospiraceae bacterium]
MYQFTEDCKIGIDKVDEEHRHLFEVINAAMELLSQGDEKRTQLIELLEELKAYAATHFAHEEAYMEQIHDPELELQKQQHSAFVEKINSIDLSKIDIGKESQMLNELMIYLTRWLYHHILGSDIMIGKMKETKEWKETKDPCAFTEKYLTGITMVDEEHKTLFEIIGAANALVKAELLHDKYDEIVGILERLKSYTEVHFRDEEAYMEKIKYSRIEAQKRAHAAFEEKLAGIDLEEVDEKQQEYLEELMNFLFGWLSNHILMSDKLIGEEVRAQNQ